MNAFMLHGFSDKSFMRNCVLGKQLAMMTNAGIRWEAHIP